MSTRKDCAGQGEASPDQAREFYEARYRHDEYACVEGPEQHSKWAEVQGLVERYGLQGKRCLEIGCGRGYFQDLVSDYTGLDYSGSVGRHLHRPFVQGSATALPFADSTFDAAWTINTLEHVPGPEAALLEMRRVLKPGGLLLLSPAWQCRPWAADGYPVRPYRDFDWRGKLIKASVPMRESFPYRCCRTLSSRLASLLRWLTDKRATPFRYRQLTPNYDHHWMSDGDAVNAMDAFEAILWFVSRGDECLSYHDLRRQVLVRTNGVVFRIRK